MQKLSGINRLIKKINWSTSDLKEFGQLTGLNFIKTGNLLHIGVDIKNMEQFMKNLPEISSKIDSAKQTEHFLEVVSLNLQIIDFYLRLLVNETEGKKVPAREFFRENLKRAEKYLSKKLFTDIENFNDLRTKVIHRYILGEISYKDIERVSNRYDNLPALVDMYLKRYLAIKLYKNL